MNTILTPISLWKEFEDTENVRFRILSERKADGLVHRKINLIGRMTEKGSVCIYGEEIYPEVDEGTKLPALLLLVSAEVGMDTSLGERFAKDGNYVFCMDYRGKVDENLCTEYPEDVVYANYAQAGETLHRADQGAKKTAWYEWTAAAKYAVQYLLERPVVSCVGALGIREGGDIVWKLMTFGSLSCGICINATGWLAYDDRSKYVIDQSSMDEGRRLFVAGLDSQSYAPFVKCPVLMIVSATDGYCDVDRAYDTFARINPDYFSTIDYSIAYNGTIDEVQIKNIDMFMDKYLKNREIYIPTTPQISLEERENVMIAALTPTGEGEIESAYVCFSEDEFEHRHACEWMTATNGKRTLQGVEFPLSFYAGTKLLFAYGRVKYSSGFTVSSKITVKKIERSYPNSLAHSNVLFDSSMNAVKVFFPADNRRYELYCFPKEHSDHMPKNEEGYGKIVGATCQYGLKMYRVGASRFIPAEKALLHFNVYSDEDCRLKVAFARLGENGMEQYEGTMSVVGGEKWQKFVAEAENFHSANGNVMSSFSGCRFLSITEEQGKKFIVTNVIWI